MEALVTDMHYKNLIYDILLPQCYKAGALSLSIGEIEKPADDLETWWRKKLSFSTYYDSNQPLGIQTP